MGRYGNSESSYSCGMKLRKRKNIGDWKDVGGVVGGERGGGGILGKPLHFGGVRLICCEHVRLFDLLLWYFHSYGILQ